MKIQKSIGRVYISRSILQLPLVKLAWRAERQIRTQLVPSSINIGAKFCAEFYDYPLSPTLPTLLQKLSIVEIVFLRHGNWKNLHMYKSVRLKL